MKKEEEPPFSSMILTAIEKQYCREANLTDADGLFLKQMTGQPLEQFEFINENISGTRKGISASLVKADAKDMILANRDRLMNEGKFIFISEFAGNGSDYVVTIVGDTNDPYKIMEWSETNGLNHNIDTKDIVEKYRQWNNRFGVIPFAIGFDFCECEIINKQIDYIALANEVYEFCPDVVDQGTETIEALAAEIMENGTIFLWWD